MPTAMAGTTRPKRIRTIPTVMAMVCWMALKFLAQAVRSNKMARKITDCTYLAQGQLETLMALPWSSSSTPAELTTTHLSISSALASEDSDWGPLNLTADGASGSAASEINAGWEAASTTGMPRPTYTITWDVISMDGSSTPTWVMLRVRCSYNDETFNLRNGTTLTGYRYRDEDGS